jgi:WD40 repeat protein
MILFALLLAAAPEISYQTSHKYSPSVFALSPDGNLMAAAAVAEEQVRIWDLGTQQLLRVVPTDQQSHLAFSADGKQLAISNQGSTRLLDVETGAELPEAPWMPSKDGKIIREVSFAFGQKGQLFATVTHSPDALLYWSSPAPQWSQLTVEPFSAFELDPRGERGLLASETSLALLDAKGQTAGPAVTKRVPSPLTGKQDWAFTAAGKYLMGASAEAIVLLDAKTLELVKKFPAPAKKGEALPRVARMQLGKIAIAQVNEQLVRVDTAALAVSSTAPLAGTAHFFRQDGGVAFTVHGNTAASDDQMFTAVDPATGLDLGSFGGAAAFESADIRFDWQDRIVWVSAGGMNGTDLADGQVTRVLDVGSARELYSAPKVFGSLSPDGRILITTGSDLQQEARSLETSALKPLLFSKPGEKAFSYAGGTWSASGRLKAFQSWRDGGGGNVNIWDFQTGTLAAQVHEDAGLGAWEAVFSADDKLAAVSIRPANKYGRDNWTFRVVELATGKVLLEHKGVVRAFTRDGAGVALSGDLRDLTGEVLAVQSGQPMERLFREGERNPPWPALVSRLHVEPWSQAQEHLTGRASVNLSPDGKVMAVGSPSGQLQLFDDRGKERRSFHAHDGQIAAIRFSSDGKRMLTYGADGLTCLWATETGEKVATFAVTGWKLYTARELVIYTPDGYYYGQSAAVRKIGVRNGLRAWPIAQFDGWLNRPDIVLSRLGGASPAIADYYRLAHERRLVKLGLPLGSGDKPPPIELPEVRLSRDGFQAKTNQRRQPLVLELLPHGAPIAGVQVYDNGVALFGPKGAPPGALTVELTSGPNKLEVTATDTLGRESVAAVVRTELEIKPVKPDLYALAVGVSRYSQSVYSLQYAAKDAQDLLAALNEPDGKKVYANIHTRIVTDAEATREGILLAARGFLSQAKIDDRVLVFFAGHGLLDARAGYFFATADLDFEKPEDRGLSFEQMEALLLETPSRHRLMLVDTCAAGETDEDEVARKAGNLPAGTMVASRGFKARDGARKESPSTQLLLTRELFGSMRRGSGASVIGSSSGVEYAFESAELKNGVFTAALLETLRGKDVSGQLLWADDMPVDLLEQSVREKVLQRSGGRQHPVARETNPDDRFVVWYAGWAKDKPQKKRAPKAKR